MGLLAGRACAEAPPALDEALILERAQEIVRDFTPEKALGARAFRNGLRVVGVTVETAPQSGSGQAAGPQFDIQLPDWLDPDCLLGQFRPGTPSVLRLLWQVEPTPESEVDEAAFSVRLQFRHGYNTYNQENDPDRIRRLEHPPGTVLWTAHRFEDCIGFTPGLYNVLVTSRTHVETMPLGQVLVLGVARSLQHTEEKLRGLFPEGFVVFGGNAVLTQWTSYHFPVHDVPFTPRYLVVISTADWLLKEGQLTEVATMEVARAAGTPEAHVVRLGRDTAAGWYDLHARGSIPHERPPVAWSWPIQRDANYFDAHAYQARFQLEAEGIPEAIDVRYTHRKVILRINGLVLLP